MDVHMANNIHLGVIEEILSRAHLKILHNSDKFVKI